MVTVLTNRQLYSEYTDNDGKCTNYYRLSDGECIINSDGEYINHYRQ